MLLLILMWTLMGQTVHGKSSTYDDSKVAAYAAGVDGDDGDGQDVIEEDAATKRTMVSTTRNKRMTMMTTATTAYEDSHNNAAIYGHINENDNNSNKLPQNVAGEGNQQPPAGMLAAPSPPAEQVRMAKDQLNETDYENAPEDQKDIVCQDQQKENNGLKFTTIECDGQIKVNHNLSEVTTEVNVDEMAAATSADEPDQDVGSGERDIDLTSELQAQLIRQFAVRYKKIARVTLFTCKTPCRGMPCEDNNKNRRSTLGNWKTVKLLQQLYLQDPFRRPSCEGNSKPTLSDNGLLLKVVQIDHLITKRRADSNTARQRGRAERKDGRNVGATPGRATFTNPNWLDQILRPEFFAQIVVVDLSCGLSSRRLLEMASNKALFNSMYHWLLMEDYVFNRQTEIDDADDMKNKMKSGCSSISIGTSTSTSTRSTTTGSSGSIEGTGNSNNADKEVVNDSSKSAMLAKELFFSSSTSDVVGASASGSGKLNKKQLASNCTPSSATTSGGKAEASTSDTSAAGAVAGASVGVGVGGADEDDMEIIENFLGKLNININTELILAKRRMRSIAETTSDSAADPAPAVPASTQSIMMPSVANSASSGSGDYNTLQKMDYYILYDVWNPGLQYGGDLNSSEVGDFSLHRGLQLAEWFVGSSFIMRRLDMQLARIRCLVVVTHKNSTNSLLEYLTSHTDTHLDSMNRFNFALLSHVRDLFNFSFILSKTPTWGYLKNGKFDGMIGALVRKQADIGGSPIFFRIERAKVIDYTTRTWVARPCFIFRHPRSTKKDRIVFLQPFSNAVWILLAACGVATILLLWLLTTLEPEGRPVSAVVPAQMFPGGGFKKRLVRWTGLLCGYDIRDNNAATQRVGLFLESILFYVGSICQQGLSFSTRSFSGRCIVMTSLLFSFAIYQFYSASIVGTLLMEKQKTIRTLRDLIHTSLEIGIEDIAYNRDYFLRTKDPDAQELYAKKVTSIPAADGTGFVDAPPDSVVLPTPAQTPMTEAQKAKAYRDILHSHETGAHAKTNDASNWYEPEYGVAKIRKGHFAFHVDVATAYKIMADTFSEKEICDLTEIQLFPPQKMVSIVQKGSPLRKPITYGLRRVTEVGLTDYERKIWHSPKPRCVKQLHTDDLRVDMQTFSSALLVLLFGLLVSGLILSLEIVHHRMWHQYTTTTTTTTAT